MTVPLTRIAGHDVLFVMAAEAEYGPALHARFTPLITGIGPVEAAIGTTAALSGARPDLVVSLGSAGSARLPQGSVYQIGAVGWRDMDASALGFARGVVPFLNLPEILQITPRIPGLPVASLSTGGNIVNGAAYADIAQDMVDMETYAVLRASQRFDVPLIGLRGISDGAAELRHIDDWTALLDLIDARLAEAVDLLAAALADGALLRA